MPRLDAGNPYQAPGASLAALRAELRRPPVHTAIALFCWALSAFALGVFGVLAYHVVARVGWARLLAEPGVGPRIFLFATLVLACMLGYLAAGRLLWVRRDRPGLILSVGAIATTYLAVLAYSAMANRPPLRVSDPRVDSASPSSTARPFPSDHA